MKKNCNIDSKFKALISPLSAEKYGALEASSEQMALPQAQQVVHKVEISEGLKAKAKKTTTHAKPAVNHHHFEQKLREEAQKLVKETLKLAEDVTALKAKFLQLYESLAKAEHEIGCPSEMQAVSEENNDDLPISVATLPTL